MRHESVYWINLGVLGKLSTEQLASGSIKSWTLASAELLKAVIGSIEESNPQRDYVTSDTGIHLFINMPPNGASKMSQMVLFIYISYEGHWQQ